MCRTGSSISYNRTFGWDWDPESDGSSSISLFFFMTGPPSWPRLLWLSYCGDSYLVLGAVVPFLLGVELSAKVTLVEASARDLVPESSSIIVDSLS